jgi:uncharacterized RDD family membrane protein YckC
MAVNDALVAERAAYAGFWRRFAAWAIDYLIVLLAGIVLGAVVIRAGIIEKASLVRKRRGWKIVLELRSLVIEHPEHEI